MSRARNQDLLAYIPLLDAVEANKTDRSDLWNEYFLNIVTGKYDMSKFDGSSPATRSWARAATRFRPGTTDDGNSLSKPASIRLTDPPMTLAPLSPEESPIKAAFHLYYCMGNVAMRYYRLNLLLPSLL